MSNINYRKVNLLVNSDIYLKKNLTKTFEIRVSILTISKTINMIVTDIYKKCFNLFCEWQTRFTLCPCF